MTPRQSMYPATAAAVRPGNGEISIDVDAPRHAALSFEPAEYLTFGLHPAAPIKAYQLITIMNLHPTQTTFFSVKTLKPERYFIKPSKCILGPRERIVVRIELRQALYDEVLVHFTQDHKLVTDRLLVQSGYNTNELNNKVFENAIRFKNEMKSKEKDAAWSAAWKTLPTHAIHSKNLIMRFQPASEDEVVTNNTLISSQSLSQTNNSNFTLGRSNSEVPSTLRPLFTTQETTFSIDEGPVNSGYNMTVQATQPVPLPQPQPQPVVVSRAHAPVETQPKTPSRQQPQPTPAIASPVGVVAAAANTSRKSSLHKREKSGLSLTLSPSTESIVFSVSPHKETSYTSIQIENMSSTQKICYTVRIESKFRCKALPARVGWVDVNGSTTVQLELAISLHQEILHLLGHNEDIEAYKVRLQIMELDEAMFATMSGLQADAVIQFLKDLWQKTPKRMFVQKYVASFVLDTSVPQNNEDAEDELAERNSQVSECASFATAFTRAPPMRPIMTPLEHLQYQRSLNQHLLPRNTIEEFRPTIFDDVVINENDGESESSQGKQNDAQKSPNTQQVVTQAIPTPIPVSVVQAPAQVPVDPVAAPEIRESELMLEAVKSYYDAPHQVVDTVKATDNIMEHAEEPARVSVQEKSTPTRLSTPERPSSKPLVLEESNLPERESIQQNIASLPNIKPAAEEGELISASGRYTQTISTPPESPIAAAPSALNSEVPEVYEPVSEPKPSSPVPEIVQAPYLPAEVVAGSDNFPSVTQENGEQAVESSAEFGGATTLSSRSMQSDTNSDGDGVFQTIRESNDTQYVALATALASTLNLAPIEESNESETPQSSFIGLNKGPSTPPPSTEEPFGPSTPPPSTEEPSGPSTPPPSTEKPSGPSTPPPSTEKPSGPSTPPPSSYFEEPSGPSSPPFFEDIIAPMTPPSNARISTIDDDATGFSILTYPRNENQVYEYEEPSNQPVVNLHSPEKLEPATQQQRPTKARFSLLKAFERNYGASTTPTGLVTLTPQTLIYHMDVGTIPTSKVSLHNHTSSMVVYKIKSAQPQRYRVKPSQGFLEPLGQCEVSIGLHSPAYDELMCLSKLELGDIRDCLLVETVKVTNSRNANAIRAAGSDLLPMLKAMWSSVDKKQVNASRLFCEFSFDDSAYQSFSSTVTAPVFLPPQPTQPAEPVVEPRTPPASHGSKIGFGWKRSGSNKVLRNEF